MASISIFPGKYIQGNGELKNLSKYIKDLGNKLLFLVSKSGMNRVSDIIKGSYENTASKIVFEIFNVECSESEITRIQKIFKENNSRYAI